MKGSASKIFIIFLLFSVSLPLLSLERKDFYGNWSLIYKDGYGYEFRFKENYIAYVILFQKNSFWVFKGVYSVENNELCINISDMKSEKNRSKIEKSDDFLKARSRFVFKVKKQSKSSIELTPKTIIVDDNESPGYFEPDLILKRRN